MRCLIEAWGIIVQEKATKESESKREEFRGQSGTKTPKRFCPNSLQVALIDELRIESFDTPPNSKNEPKITAKVELHFGVHHII